MNDYCHSQDPFQNAPTYGQTKEGHFPTLTHPSSEQTYQYPAPIFNQPPPLNSPNAEYQYSLYLNHENNGLSFQNEAEVQVQAPPEPTMPKTKRSAKGKGKSNGDTPPSKRQARRQKIEAEHGNIGARDMPKGKTRMGSNGLEWWDKDQQIWRSAAPHDNYRNEMIHLDRMFGRYDFTPKHGVHEDDVTTFSHAYGQQHWNLENRSTWGNIRDDNGNQVMYLLDQPLARETEPVSSGFMIFNGLLMLDPDDNPINDWPGLPRCFSSQLEGARMEALRRIYPMTIPDFRARMPRNIKNKGGATRSLFGLSTFNHRLLRFRRDYECPAWVTREKEHGLKKFTLERLAAEGSSSAGSPSLTTESLTPPSKYEKERRKLENAGKNPEKAGGRAITEEEREARAKKAARRLQKLEKQEATRRHTPTAPSPENLFVQDSYHSADSYAPPPAPSRLKHGRDDEIDENINDYITKPPQKRARRSPKMKSTLDPSIAEAEQSALFAMSADQVPKPEGPRQISGLAQPPSQPVVGVDFYSFNLGRKVPADVPDFDFGDDADISTPIVPAPPRPQDLRYVRPRNLAEQLNIKAALLYTCLDYSRYHGEGPPNLPDEESFAEQYQRLLTLHRNYWTQLGQAPPLVLAGKWFGSFSQVPAPELTEEVAGQLLGTSAESTAESSMPETTGTVGDMSISEWTEQVSDEIGHKGAPQPLAEPRASRPEDFPTIGTNDESNDDMTNDALPVESDDQYFNELFVVGVLTEDDLNAIKDLPD